MPPLTDPTEGITPRPWRTVPEDASIGCIIPIVAMQGALEVRPAYVPGLADTNLIVRAVNERDDLISERDDLASALRSVISAWEDPGVWGTVHAMGRAVSYARLVLTKAGEVR